MGRIVPELDEANIRELILRNYRIIYRISGDTLQIVRLFHGSRIMDFKF
jgi:plasmid stabilization system protein ParE